MWKACLNVLNKPNKVSRKDLRVTPLPKYQSTEEEEEKMHAKTQSRLAIR